MTTKIKILLVRNEDPFPKELWDVYMSLLPIQQQLKIERYLFWKDKQARLLSKLLLMEVLANKTPKLSLSDVKYGEFNKPYVEDDLSFNISHSGGYVVCASVGSYESIGIDIEKIDEQININDFKEIFSVAEWSYIQSSSDKRASFYDLWTIKESAVKADGRGLRIPLDKVNVQNGNTHIDNKKRYYKEVKVDDNYKCHLALDIPYITIDVKEVSVFNLCNTIYSHITKLEQYK